MFALTLLLSAAAGVNAILGGQVLAIQISDDSSVRITVPIEVSTLINGDGGALIKKLSAEWTGMAKMTRISPTPALERNYQTAIWSASVPRETTPSSAMFSNQTPPSRIYATVIGDSAAPVPR